jgi:glucose/arabinose dehydrogenase
MKAKSFPATESLPRSSWLALVSLLMIMTAASVSYAQVPAVQPQPEQPAEPEGPTTFPNNIALEVVADRITFPVALQFAADGRLFFTERFIGANEPVTGTIRVMVDGQVQREPFAVIAVADSTPYAEKGLLGLALDPEFETNGFVYTYRTAAAAQAIPREHGQILRYTAVLSDTNWIGEEMTVVVDDLPVSSGCCHNGGILGFGPDEKLYLSIGDNGNGANAQDLGNRIGKILRFNRDGSSPDDNPFADDPEADSAVYAYGLRNVFGFDWHPESGELYATDNGPNCDDELNLIVAGGNYGWPLSEQDGECVDPGPEYVAPLVVFDQTPQGRPPGVTGAAFYTGRQLSEYTNDLFVAAWNEGTLYRIETPDEGDPETTSVLTNCGQTEGEYAMLDVAAAPDGSLYFSCQEDTFPAPPSTGTIYRLVRRPPSIYLPLIHRGTSNPTIRVEGETHGR